tara:strand:- start:34 stop:714 length:681 start_codon:yes stop_codon:yes gene_type:complete
MADIFAEVDEAMKQEKLQKLWENYGSLIIGAIILVILGTIGYEVNKGWKDSTNLKQTEKMLVLLEGENTDEIIKQAAELQPGLEGLTLLNVAGNLARDGKTEEAFKLYQNMSGNTSLPRDIRSLADFMVLRLMLNVEAGQGVTAEKVISGLEKVWNNPENPLRFHARLEAAIILANNIKNYADARNHLEFLMTEKSVPDSLKQKALSLDVLYSLKQDVAKKEGESN